MQIAVVIITVGYHGHGYLSLNISGQFGVSQVAITLPLIGKALLDSPISNMIFGAQGRKKLFKRFLILHFYSIILYLGNGKW